MSTFLSRVAARAAGTHASATPRPVARYEPAPGSELVERAEERVGSDLIHPARRRQGPQPATPEKDSHTPPSPPAREPQRHEFRPPAAKPRLRPIELRETEVVAERIDTMAWRGPGPARRSPAEPRTAPRTAPRTTPGTTPGATPPTPVGPITPAAPNPASHPHQLPPPPPADARGPDVRVHIGRLEVRANLQQAPPPPRRREPEPAPQLSLTDYLHGSRRA